MDILFLGLGATLGFFVIFIIIGWRTAKANEIGRRMKQEERQAERAAAKRYREECKERGWPVPLSTDEFYKGF